jgi:hypothetical protein
MPGTKFPELFKALSDPFAAHEVKARTQGGRQLHYVTAATVDNRLDTVCGPENWWPQYGPLTDKSVTCGLTIRLPDGSLVTKWDCGGSANMTDEGDDDKSAYSDARKRAACVWGVGRYLRKDGVPTFVASDEPAEAPPLATRKLVAPAVAAQAAASDADGLSREIQNRPPPSFSPQTGHELVGWLAKREKEYPGISRRLADWAASARLPVKILGWDGPTVKRAYAKARAAIEEIDKAREGKLPIDPVPAPGEPVPALGNGAYSRR